MKIRNYLLFLTTLLFFTSFKAADCTTTFKLLDCEDKPVQGATVIVERCADKKKFYSVTNQKGEASFPLCKNEICKTQIMLAGYTTKDVRGVGDNCKGTDRNINCEIKICSE